VRRVASLSLIDGWQRPTWTRELLCEQMKMEGFENHDR
jgi:hypothetical protein